MQTKPPRPNSAAVRTADKRFLRSEAARLAALVQASDVVEQKRLADVFIRELREEMQSRAIAEEARELAHSQFTGALKAGNMGSWTLDLAANELDASETFKKNFGRSPGEPFTYAELLSTIAPTDLARWKQAIGEAIESRGEFEIEYRNIWPDGSEHWVLVHGNCIPDPVTGESDHLAGVSIDTTERKLAERALRHSSIFNQEIIDSLAEHLAVIDGEGVITAINDAWRRFAVDNGADWSTAGVGVGANYIQVCEAAAAAGDDDARAILTGVRRVLNGEDESFSIEYPCHSPSTQRWFLLHIAPLTSQPGAVITHLNITQRKLTEQQVTENEKQLRVITDAMPALISLIDSDYRYRFANHAYYDWFGRSPEEVIGRTMAEVLGDAAFDKLRPHADAALAGRTEVFETETPYGVGGTRFIHATYLPNLGGDGQVLGMFVLVLDMTERKIAEKAMAHGMAIISSSDDAIISKGLDGIITSWNAGASRLFGYTSDEAIGQPVLLLIPTEFQKEEPKILARIRRGESIEHYETVRKRKDGTLVDISLSVSPIRDPSGTIIGASKIARDITERRRAKEALQKAKEELETRVEERTAQLAEMNQQLSVEIEERRELAEKRAELLQKMVTVQEDERKRIARDLHDQLGQQLTALRLNLMALHSGASLDDKVTGRIEKLQEIAKQIDSSVTFISGQLRPTALDDLGLSETLKMHAEEWSQRFEIPVEFHSNVLRKNRLPGEVETHLYRITQEALNNTVKHADASEVAIVLEKSDNGAVLVIEDNGCGFDPSMKSVPIDGHGFGIVGMHERANLIGATLEIESKPGQGTTIYVRVPAAKSAGLGLEKGM